MALDSLLFGAVGSVITWLFVLWVLITFRRRIAKMAWESTFRDLMWISFANAEKEVEAGDLDLGGSLGEMPFQKYLPLIELLIKLDQSGALKQGALDGATSTTVNDWNL